MYKSVQTPGHLLAASATMDSRQKTMCAFCHGSNPGAGDHTLDAADPLTGRATMAAAGSFRRYTGGTADALDGSSGAYSWTNYMCQNLVCHNRVNTPATAGSNWQGTGTGNCTTLCHSV